MTVTLLIISSIHDLESQVKHRVRLHLRRIELLVVLGYVWWVFLVLTQIWRIAWSSEEEPLDLPNHLSYRIVIFTGAVGYYIATFTLLMLCMIVCHVITNSKLTTTDPLAGAAFMKGPES